MVGEDNTVGVVWAEEKKVLHSLKVTHLLEGEKKPRGGKLGTSGGEGENKKSFSWLEKTVQEGKTPLRDDMLQGSETPECKHGSLFLSNNRKRNNGCRLCHRYEKGGEDISLPPRKNTRARCWSTSLQPISWG